MYTKQSLTKAFLIAIAVFVFWGGMAEYGNALADTSDVYVRVSQLLLGYAVGVASGVALGYLGVIIDVDDDELWLLSTFGSGELGGAIVSSVTVYAIGQKWGHWDGSLTWTVVGAVTPVVIGALVGVIFLEGAPDGADEWDAWTVTFQASIGGFVGSLASPIGAMIGYYLSKEKKQAAINIEGGHIQLGMPHLKMQTTHLPNHRPETDYTLRLVSARF